MTRAKKTYVCGLCKKEFKQKNDYDRHMKKKSPCIPMEKIKALTETKEVKTDNKTKLFNVFNSCLGIFRDNENLTSDKALRPLAHFLILRLL